MLKLRILTAVVLLLVVLATVLLGPRWLLLALLGVGMFAAAYEWATLAALAHWLGKLGYGVLVIALAALGWWWTQQTSGGIQMILLAAALIWIVAFFLVVKHPRVPLPAITGGGAFLIAAAWLAAVALYDLPRGKYWLLLVLALVWAADIGAYFAGRAFGSHKLAPAVSPGKTWEGLAGGVVLALIVAFVGGWWLAALSPTFLGVCLFAVLASVIGDLTESLFKRQRGIKDSGRLLPGHGGVLDRLDSLLAALPVFALGLSLGLSMGLVPGVAAA